MSKSGKYQQYRSKKELEQFPLDCISTWVRSIQYLIRKWNEREMECNSIVGNAIFSFYPGASAMIIKRSGCNLALRQWEFYFRQKLPGCYGCEHVVMNILIFFSCWTSFQVFLISFPLSSHLMPFAWFEV